MGDTINLRVFHYILIIFGKAMYRTFLLILIKDEKLTMFDFENFGKTREKKKKEKNKIENKLKSINYFYILPNLFHLFNFTIKN